MHCRCWVTPWSGTLSPFATLYRVDNATAAVTEIAPIANAHNVLGGWGLALASGEN